MMRALFLVVLLAPGAAWAQASAALCLRVPSYIGCRPAATALARVNTLPVSVGDVSRSATLGQVSDLVLGDVLAALGDGTRTLGLQALEMGRVGVVGPSFLDFHTSAFSNDYDARILAEGGSAGGNGLGSLVYAASAGHRFTNGSVRVGPTGWLESLIGGTEALAGTSSLSPIGGIGVLGACRTTDGPTANDMRCQGVSAFALNFNTTAVQSAYGLYVEARRGPGAGITHNIETNIVNTGSSVAITPYTMVQAGITPNIWVTSGRTDVVGSAATTAAIAIMNNGAANLSGIVFGNNSLSGTDGTTGTANAIQMARGHAIIWHRPGDSGVAARIRSDVTSTTGGGSIVFSDGGTVLQNAAGIITLVSSQDTTNGLSVLVGGALKAIQVGPTDSAGTGFRALRVAN